MSVLIESVKTKMIEYFGEDHKRIKHALMVAEYSSKILCEEKANDEVVLSAAYLHDIGILEAEKKYNSSAGRYQEIEGPPIAKEILISVNASEKIINHVCSIVSRHHTLNGVNSLEFQILYEADWIVNLMDDYKHFSIDKKRRLIEKNFKTDVGKIIAYQVISES